MSKKLELIKIGIAELRVEEFEALCHYLNVVPNAAAEATAMQRDQLLEAVQMVLAGPEIWPEEGYRPMLEAAMQQETGNIFDDLETMRKARQP